MILRARRLTKKFGGVTALDAVSFELRAGEIHALCGENGAGKSTLIKLLSGVHAHGSYAGHFEVDGHEARFRDVRDAAAAGIAVIHQELSCVDEFDVAENICLGAEPRRLGIGFDRAAARRRAREVLDQFGVPIDAAAAMRSLGVGQKQLVEIVKALARRSRILILDEPTAALARHEVDVLLAILGRLRASGISCIYISHRLDEVFQIADRVTVLRDGATVGTLGRGEMNETDVVRMMVGREIRELFARTPGAPGPEVLSVERLSADAGADGPQLRDVSFTLRAGEVLGVGGLMGAGRSELLMHLFGVWGRRRAGRVLLAGAPLPAGDPPAVLRAGMALVSEDRRRLGLFLDESIGFNMSLSALDGLSSGGIIRRRDEAAENHRWFESLKIKAAGLDAVVGRLSGGNQQKVVLAKALMTQPRVVLLDEPTRGIDIGAKLEVYGLIDRLTAAGCAVLLVSSELPELIGISDRILMLNGGRVTGRFEGAQLTPEVLMQAALAPAPALRA